jgi:integrase
MNDRAQGTAGRTWVDKLKTPAKGQEDHSANHPGLKVRVFASGRRVWFIRGRLKGGESAPVFVMLGEYPAMGEHAAKKAAGDARYLLRQGIDPNQRRDENILTNKIAGMTFGELAEEYLEKGTANLRANTTLKYRANALRGKWFADWRPRPLSWLTQGRVNALQNTIPTTAASTPLTSLRSALRYAEDNGYIAKAPRVTVPKSQGDAAPFLEFQEGGGAPDFGELAVVLDALDALQERFPLSPWPHIWRFGALTGARPMTVCGARWEEFDLSSAPIWHLSAERSKLKRPIDIPLSEAAAAVLRALPRKESGFIWPGRDGTKPREDLPGDQTGLITGMLAARGYRTTFWPGRFRDTFMTWLDVQEHASERAIALLVDHKAPAERTTRGRHYAKVQSAALARRLANEWAATIANVRAAAAQAGPAVVQLPAQRAA